MSDPTALLLSLLIGVVGAAVGVVGLLAVQGWQLKVAKDQAKAASRLIYLEITYNVSVLEATARIGTGGVPLLVSSQLWQQHSDKLVNLLRETRWQRWPLLMCYSMAIATTSPNTGWNLSLGALAGQMCNSSSN
jgi:hypothetical protein